MGDIKRRNICIGDNREEICSKISGVHINIRSINKNFEQLRIMMIIENKNIKWDFIALTECWACD